MTNSTAMMSGKSGVFQALSQGKYTLTQAAQILDIDLKTLKKRMKLAQIQPIVPSDDRRLRLLNEEHLERLRGTLDSAGKTPRAAAVMGGAVSMIKQLARRIAKIEERLTHQEEELKALRRQMGEAEQLKREIAWRTEEWERTTGSLLALVGALQREFVESNPDLALRLAEEDRRALGLGGETNGLNLRSPAEAQRVAAALIGAITQNNNLGQLYQKDAAHREEEDE